MKKNIIIFAVGFIFFPWNSIALADELGLSMFTFFGDRSITQSSDDPLMLFVTVENSAAKIVERQNNYNRQILDQFSKTPEYKTFSEKELEALSNDYPINEIPSITLGSNVLSAESLIEFVVRDEDGKTVDLDFRPLASNDAQNSAQELVHGKALFYQFILSTDALKPLTTGNYYLVATVDTSDQNAMWQGVAYSNPVKVTLVNEHPNPNWQTSDARAFMLSSYLVGDHKYADAEKHARSWVDQHPDSVDAWAQLGEALYGQNKMTEAQTALNTALSKFRLKNGGNPPELPDELLRRIDDVTTALAQ